MADPTPEIGATEKEGTGDRASTKAEKIRKRLGWEAGNLNGNGDNPWADEKLMLRQAFWNALIRDPGLVFAPQR